MEACAISWSVKNQKKHGAKLAEKWIKWGGTGGPISDQGQQSWDRAGLKWKIGDPLDLVGGFWFHHVKHM